LRDYILFELKGFVKKRKTLYLILVLLGGAFLLFGAIQFQDLGNHEAQMYDELNQTRLALRSVETYYTEDSDEETLSDNIYRQQSLAATMYNGILFEDTQWLSESGQELAELRIEFSELNENEDLPPSLFPPLHESKRQIAEYGALNQSNHPVQVDSRNTSSYLRLLMQYFGLFAFIFLVVFASDIGIEDFRHQSMVDGYPIHPVARIFTQISIYFTSILTGSLFVLLIAILFVSLFWRMTDLTYPMAIFSFGEFQAIPVWEGLLWFILYYAFLTLHIIALSLLLNHLFKNMYATIVGLVFLYSLPLLFPNLFSTLTWTPLPYYQMTPILKGAIAEQSPFFADVQSAVFILLLYTILTLLFLVFFKRSSINLFKRR